ncbi:MAG: phosphoribosylformylglycinamidine cyclo-ligase [Clostridia bacterium]|nr:phosphoribosylformylglycinamidine cyclo-ligase [Clostridia bacterium]
MSESYKNAGVDVEAGYEAVRLMKADVKKTFIDGVMSDIGGFGGLFSINKDNYEEPVLVSGTDGVGTKLKMAFIADKHDTVGIDAVAMCVNDVVCSGAKPLFFLDYVAVGKNVPEKVATIVKGVADGCVQAGCALIGGETAEMPGFYPVDEYDIAGFTVGIVDKKDIIDGSKLSSGDALIGIASSGVHSNGFSLVRKVFDVREDNEKLKEYNEFLGDSLVNTLLTPTKIYVKSALKLIEECDVRAISHITGGGFYENIPRMLPANMKAVIKKDSFEVLPIFKLLQEVGNIPERDMFNTFNMGIGMIAAVPAAEAEKAVKVLEEMGEKAYIIGTVEDGENGVELI